MERTVLLLDAGFLDKVAARHAIRWDYERLPAAVTANDKLVRTFFYYCMPYQGDPPSADDAGRYRSYQKFVSFRSR